MPEVTAQDDATGAAATAAAAQAATSEPKKLEMTQDEFDRIIAERVNRAKPKDYDDLVKLRDERDAAEEAKKTELQKEKDARIAAEQKAAEKDSKSNAKLIRAAVMTEATAQGAVDSDLVVRILAEGLTVDDEGEVPGVKAAVTKLLKEKPFLAGRAASASGGEFGGNGSQTIDEKIAEAERAGKFNEARELKIQKGLGIV